VIRLLPNCLLVFLSSVIAFGAVARCESVPSMDDYAIVLKRNVFDPSRRPVPPPPPVKHVEHVAPPPPPPSPPAPVEVPRFADLHGLLLDGNQIIAFVSGSNSEWCGTRQVAVGKEIGPGIVTVADSCALTLQIGELSVRWPVGKRLRGVDGTWSVEGQAGAPATPTSATDVSATSTSTETPDSVAPDEGGASDILRKLMERRRKEQGL